MSRRAHLRGLDDPKDLRRLGEVSAVVHDPGEPPNDVDIQALAERVFGTAAKADAWLCRPNPSMSGQVPRDLLKDSLGIAVVRETLEQIDNGIFA